MTEWKEYKFSDFVDINPLVRIPKNIPISFVEMKDLDPSMRYCESSQLKLLSGGSRFINGDTLFARITPCLENGKICQVRYLQNNIGFGSTEFHVFRAKNGISDTNFVYYLSRWNEVREHAELNFEGSSGRQRVSKEAFDNLYLLLPPLPEQIRIASILSSLDDKIDLLHRENKTLEAMAETLFKELVVNENNDGTLENIISIQNGYAFKSKDFKETGEHQIIKIKNISSGIIDIDSTDCVDSDVLVDVSTKFKVNSGDVLIAMTGAEIGKLGVIPKNDKSLWLNQRVGLLVEKYKGAKYLAYLQLKSEYGQDYIENTATGSAQPNISGTGIEQCGFPILDEEIIIQISKQIGEFYDKIILNLGQINVLKNTLNSMQFQLFNR